MTVNAKMNKFVTMENASNVPMTIIVHQAKNAMKMNAKNHVRISVTVINPILIVILIIKFVFQFVIQIKIVNLDIGVIKNNATNLAMKKTSVWHLDNIATSMISNFVPKYLLV